MTKETKKIPDPTTELRQNAMMRYLLESLDEGKDIGHYGKLIVAIVGHYFLPDDAIVALLLKAPDETDERARALVAQVSGRGYSPPKRERVLEWQAKQQFALCENPDDPDSCNLYKDLTFPPEVYEHITEYHEHKAAS